MSSVSFSEQVACPFWAKTLSDDTTFPLDAHLVDTGAAALALWDLWLAPNVKHMFSEMFGASARETTALVAASHDIGKANPVFQAQLLSARRQRFFSYGKTLEAQGYSIPGDNEVRRLKNSGAHSLRHEVVSWFLAKKSGMADWAALALAGHHGEFHEVHRLEIDGSGRKTQRDFLERYLSDGQWSDSSSTIMSLLVSLFGEFPSHDLAAELTPSIVALAGFVSLADWLASEDKSLAHASDVLRSVGVESEYLEHRRLWFADRLGDTVGLHSTPKGSFVDLFGFSPNSCQELVAEVSGSDLCVVMAPMGIGKTEAALSRHAVLDRGLYFALPTMASSDAMFDRVRAFYERAPQSASLLHSRSMLNTFYSPSHAEFDSRWGLSPSDWLQGRHRALLSPVAVGTCDRVLMSSLRHRWLTMRLLALANKHMVVDEVHTFDAYQDRLLATLLEWMSHCGAPVTLLSATLPVRRLDRYREAWAAGARQHQVAQASPSVRAETPYPAVVVASGSRCNSFAISSTDRRQIQVTLQELPPPEVIAAITLQVESVITTHHSPAVGVVVNTIDTCLKVAAELEHYNPIVLHSRMTAAQRSAASHQLMTMAGSGGTGGRLVIGTQVIESSLDVDFDVLITQLAPVASLLQRAGRLWRHSRWNSETWEHPPSRARNRPECPECFVVSPLGFAPAACLPYSAAELRRATELLGVGSRLLTFPDDIQLLLDRADIALEDLFGVVDVEASPEIATHLAQLAERAVAADNRRIHWKTYKESRGREKLALLTDQPFMDEGFETRLTTDCTLQVLALSRYAWNMPLPTGRVSTRDVIQLLQSTLPVSGLLAKQLEQSAISLSELHPMLQSIVAVDVDDHDLVELHPEWGLMKKGAQ